MGIQFKKLYFDNFRIGFSRRFIGLFSQNYLECFAICSVLLIMSKMFWNSYHPLIMNDGDSVLYYTYAQNILNCPINLTVGRMMDAVTENCLPTIQGKDFTFYNDHPAGLSLLVAGVIKIGFESLQQIRVLFFIISLLIGLMAYQITKAYRGKTFARLVLVAILITPLYLFHSVVVHMFSITSLLSMILTLIFVKFIESRNKKNIKYLLFISFFGFIVDWPIFLLSLIFVVITFIIREYRIGLLLLIYTIISYCIIRIWLNFDQANFNEGGFTEIGGLLNNVPKLNELIGFFYYFLKAHFIVSLGFLILILYFLKNRQHLFSDSLTLFTFILFVQGTLNIFLFLGWASSHIYWSHLLIVPTSIGLAFGLNYLKTKLKNNQFNIIIASIIFISIFYSYSWWIKDYQTRPITINEYLKNDNLEILLNPGVDLISNDPMILFGQAAKLRLSINRQFCESEELCKNKKKYNIYKYNPNTSSNMNKAVYLDWFGWYIYESH